MKNCLLFIIDSLNYSHVKESPVELMPFYKELSKKSVVCQNMYSQAPYTEAAIMSLYCGQNVLDHGGYMFRFKESPQTIFEVMRDAGYETFYNSYQPQCHPSSVKRGVEALYYDVGYDQAALWSYRFRHYSEVKNKDGLTKEDYETLYEIFEDNFNEWIRFTDCMLTNDPSVSMICDNASDYDPAAVKQQVLDEKARYCENPQKYVDEVLAEGTQHRLFKIPAYRQDHKISDREAMPQMREALTPLIQRIHKLHLKRNMRNACWKICANPLKAAGKLLRHPSKEKVKDLAKAGYYSLNYLLDLDLKARIGDDFDYFKDAPSDKSHIDQFVDWVKEREDSRPYFACIHDADIHNPEVFFTYDSTDMNWLQKEIEAAEDVLDQLPKNYYGGVTHDLSLRYSDNMIRYLFEQMEKNHMLEDTYVVICADHGFSFSGNPIRDSFVTNLYLENYNIPFLLYGKDLPAQSITKLCSSKDIPVTLCNALLDKAPNCYTGHDVREEGQYPCLQIEYCGGGCPDLKRRQLKMAAFDREYFVGTLGTRDETGRDTITEVYDLKKDPKQMHNLVHKEYDAQKVATLFEHITKRKLAIQNSESVEQNG